MLTVSHLTAGYGPSPVLRRISFSADDECVTAVLGPSGAGKTTLADAICGFLPVMDGQVIFDGTDITVESSNGKLRRGLSYVPAGRRLFFELTVSDNLRFGLAAQTEKSFRRRCDAVFSVFPEIRAWLPKRAGILSSGQQRILMIARGMLGGTRLLVLDQPSFALSGEEIQRVYRAISQVHRQCRTAVLLFEQFSFPALKIADTVYSIEKGRITGERSGLELIADHNLQAEFLRGVCQPTKLVLP